MHHGGEATEKAMELRAGSIRRVIGWSAAVTLGAGALAYAVAHGGRPAEARAERERKIALLLVNHGSRSEAWRKGLLGLEDDVRGPVLKGDRVRGVKTAFMEYTEPSIATRLKDLDHEGFSDVLVVPIFLTVSPHSFDDIPTIVGKKENPRSVELLKMERIERYTPRAQVHIAPLLDFTDLLRKNVLRRARALSRDASNEGLVLIAYGDETYEKEWDRLLDSVGAHVKEELGITEQAHGWCGHIAHYDPSHTTRAIQRVLEKKRRAVVVPVLVAYDEMFQVKIIGDGVAAVPNARDRVAYKPDAILPDPNVEAWVVQTTREHVDRIVGGAAATPGRP